MYELFVAIILGIVEGLTEFAPVSSTGHMMMAAKLMGVNLESKSIQLFLVVVQLGSILAVAHIFWNRIFSLLFTSKFNLLKRSFHTHFNWLHILIGMIPACLVGYSFHSWIKNTLFSDIKYVVLALLLGGLLLIIADLFRPSRASATTLDEMTYKQAFMVGMFQILALWPGFSRSGSTMSAGVLSGLSYKIAAEYTFLLALPMMVAASTKDLLEYGSILTRSELPWFLVGLITAYLSSLFVVKFFLKIISEVKFIPFAIYRFVIAILFYLLIIK